MDDPNYYAIIPAEVRYDKDLQPGAKLLYGEITALCNQKGFCWASNTYFSTLYQVSDRTIKNWIRRLNEEGYINIDFCYKTDTKMIESRCISIPVLVGKESSKGEEENFQRWGKNFPKGGEKKCLGNNTSTNTTFNNTLKENTKRKSDVENMSLGLEFNPSNLFESFWKMYPKKVAKKEANKSFLKACKNKGMYNDMTKALTTQIVVNKWDRDSQYCPNATTWLNQERWKDEVNVVNATTEYTVDEGGNKRDKYGTLIL